MHRFDVWRITTKKTPPFLDFISHHRENRVPQRPYENGPLSEEAALSDKVALSVLANKGTLTVRRWHTVVTKAYVPRRLFFFLVFLFSFFPPSPRVSVISVSPNAARKYKRTGSREWVNSARSILKNSYVCVNKSYVQDECVIIYSVNGQVSIVCGYTWSDEELVRCLGDGRIFWKGFFFVNCKNFNIDF